VALLQQKIAESGDSFVSLAFADYPAHFSDNRQVYFVLPESPGPGVSTEISVPLQLFPVSLLPLIELVDRLATRACGSHYRPIEPSLHNR
jgi:hypothetical protein